MRISEETHLGRTLEYHHHRTFFALLRPMLTRSNSAANQNSHRNSWPACPSSQHAIRMDFIWHGLRNGTDTHLMRRIVVLTMDTRSIAREQGTEHIRPVQEEWPTGTPYSGSDKLNCSQYGELCPSTADLSPSLMSCLPLKAESG